DKRNELRKTLRKVIELNKDKAEEIVILCERISTFRKSFGNKKNQQGTNPAYLKMTGALVASMVDTASEYGRKAYSEDTGSWQRRIVGTSKGDKDGNKEGQTIRFVEKLGFDLVIRYKKSGKNKGEPIYDDDAADSACICLYGFLPEKEQKLLE